MRPSIRWRLTLWNALAFAVVLAAFAALVYVLSTRALLHQTDRTLDGGFQLLASDPDLQDDPTRAFMHWVEEFREHQQLYFAVLRGDGSLCVKDPDLDLAAIPGIAFDRRREQTRGTSTSPNGERFRWQARTLSIGDTNYHVVLVASLRDVDRQSTSLLLAILLAGPIAIAISGVLAYSLRARLWPPLSDCDVRPTPSPRSAWTSDCPSKTQTMRSADSAEQSIP